MASLTQGSPLPDVNTTTTQTTTAPDYYTSYLNDVAKAGQTALSTDPSKLVAGFSGLQQQGINAVTPAATSYQPGLSAAEQTASTVAGGLNPQNIQALLNPYTQNVVDEMGRVQQQNIQRNVLPGLKAAFAGTGGMGSTRFANATGQTLADMEANLLGQQTGALQKGYSDATTAALQNLSLQNQAATTQGNLAAQEQNLGLTGAQAEINAGAMEQAQEQAKIDAALKNATNAASLMRGYTVPTSTTQKYTGPMPGAYSASPLQQAAGLASLFASGAGGTSAAAGVGNAISSLGNYVSGALTPTASTVSFAGTNADGTNVYYDSKTGNYMDSSGNNVPIAGGEGE
jgi:hypothetical protein